MSIGDKKFTPPDPALVVKYLEIQGQELVMKSKELDIKQQNDNNMLEYSKAALQANKEDRQAERVHAAKISSSRNRFTLAAIICILVFVSYALYLDKDQIVMEALKAVLYIGVGGLGGYSYAKTKKDPE